MEIWEGRYTNKEGKKESKKGFDLFQLYDEMPRPRSLPIFVIHTYFNDEDTEEIRKSQEYIRKYNSIYRLYRNYDWDDRADAHDVWIRQQNDKAILQEFNEFRLQELPNAMQRVTGHNVTYNNIKKNDTEVVVTKTGLKERPKRDSDITKSERENQEAYSLAIDDVIKLITGGVIRTENKNTGIMGLTADIRAEHTGFENLIGAFDESKKEWDKHKTNE